MSLADLGRAEMPLAGGLAVEQNKGQYVLTAGQKRDAIGWRADFGQSRDAIGWRVGSRDTIGWRADIGQSRDAAGW